MVASIRPKRSLPAVRSMSAGESAISQRLFVLCQ
jgi:hypothetical protein